MSGGSTWEERLSNEVWQYLGREAGTKWPEVESGASYEVLCQRSEGLGSGRVLRPWTHRGNIMLQNVYCLVSQKLIRKRCPVIVDRLKFIL
jgi:hypothetical protein